MAQNGGGVKEEKREEGEEEEKRKACVCFCGGWKSKITGQKPAMSFSIISWVRIGWKRGPESELLFQVFVESVGAHL